MRKKFTAIAGDKMKPGARRREIADGGCSGLYLIVQPNGKKSWAVRYRRDRRSVKLTLGPVLPPGKGEPPSQPEIGQAHTLKQARVAAAMALQGALSGNDPAVAKRQRNANTLQAICEEHLRREK